MNSTFVLVTYKDIITIEWFIFSKSSVAEARSETDVHISSTMPDSLQLSEVLRSAATLWETMRPYS